jgi:hypothetical protein
MVSLPLYTLVCNHEIGLSKWSDWGLDFRLSFETTPDRALHHFEKNAYGHHSQPRPQKRVYLAVLNHAR